MARLRAPGAAVAAGLLLLSATPATGATARSADAFRLSDPVGDAVHAPGVLDGEGVRAGTDIRSAKFEYLADRRAIRVVVGLVDLKPLVNSHGWHEQFLTVLFTGRDALERGYTVTRSPFARGSSGSVTLGDLADAPCPGDTIEIDSAKERIRIVVPKTCLSPAGQRRFRVSLYSVGTRAFEDGPSEVVYTDTAATSSALELR